MSERNSSGMKKPKQKKPEQYYTFKTTCQSTSVLFAFALVLDVKWCHISRITNPWHALDRFTGFRKREGSLGPPEKLQISHLSYSRRRYMAEILQIWRKTPFNQAFASEDLL